MHITHFVGKPLAAIFTLSFLLGSAPGAPSDQVQSLVDNNTAFGLNLYGQLAANPGNLFFSPYSISTCLAMTYAGARGDTAQQMAQVMGFGANQQHFASAYGQLQRELEAARTQKGIELNIADALWTQTGYPFLPAFLRIATDQYQANLNQADFITQADAVRAEVNHWVAQETLNRIQDILPPGSLTALTRLVLANAIYFKGAWLYPFEKTETVSQPFHLSSTSQVAAPLMHQPFVSVNYMETSDFQAVELPYGGNRLSMVILLPVQIDGLAQLEPQLDPALLWSALAQMTQQEVEVFLPRFTLGSGFELNDTLAAMGMPDPFTAGMADFSGMDGTRRLSISHVFHKAWGAVDEAGTEAA
ncbi:MAG TPA: serpin family protein, partial [Dongiaceae bacterium]|nr:serpin family protein [Dongiaceae bacterium]